MAFRLEAIAIRLEAIAIGLEAITIRLEAIAISRTENEEVGRNGQDTLLSPKST